MWNQTETNAKGDLLIFSTILLMLISKLKSLYSYEKKNALYFLEHNLKAIYTFLFHFILMPKLPKCLYKYL